MTGKSKMADKNEGKKREKVKNVDSLHANRRRPRSRSADEHRKKSNRKISQEKRKSRKRSHSESKNITDSSSSSSDSEQRKKNKRKRKRSRSSSSVSSEDSRGNKASANKKKHKCTSSSSDSKSSDSDEKQSKSKRKKKKLRKQKKTKSTHKKKKAKKKGVVDQNKYGAYGIIRESDMFTKQQEFYCWLQEVKNISSETLSKYETRKMFESYMEDYNTATLPHKKYYDLEKWEAKRQQKNALKALKKARETSFSIVDDEKRHDQLHRAKLSSNKYAGPSRQQLLEMQQELRRRQDEEYKKRAGLT